MGLALKRTQELTLGALPRYQSDLELTVGGKVALRGGGSRRGGTAAGQSEGEVEPGFAAEGLAVESWEAQSLAWSAAAEEALQARSVPPGHGPRALPALGYSQRPARGRLEYRDLPSRTKGAASLRYPAQPREAAQLRAGPHLILRSKLCVS